MGWVKAGSAAAGGGAKGAMAGLGNVAKTGAHTVGQKAADALRSGDTASSGTEGAANQQPVWAKRLQRRQHVIHAAMTTTHALRGGDGGGSGQGSNLNNSES